MATVTKYNYILLSDNGKPYIEGTTVKVSELVAERNAYGWSPEELQFQHPYLTLAQIHSALAFYWDNKESIDKEIFEDVRILDSRRISQKEKRSPFFNKLKKI